MKTSKKENHADGGGGSGGAIRTALMGVLLASSLSSFYAYNLPKQQECLISGEDQPVQLQAVEGEVRSEVEAAEMSRLAATNASDEQDASLVDANECKTCFVRRLFLFSKEHLSAPILYQLTTRISFLFPVSQSSKALFGSHRRHCRA